MYSFSSQFPVPGPFVWPPLFIGVRVSLCLARSPRLPPAAQRPTQESQLWAPRGAPLRLPEQKENLVEALHSPLKEFSQEPSIINFRRQKSHLKSSIFMRWKIFIVQFRTSPMSMIFSLPSLKSPIPFWMIA